MTDTNEQSMALLRDALTEAQTVVRAFDTKAQIVGVGYVFSLGIIGRAYEALQVGNEVTLISVLITWIIVIMPIILFGYVLYPTRKSAPKVSVARDQSATHVLFYEPDGGDTVEAIKEAVKACDPLDEMAYELLKTSRLRELKRKRFLRALFSAGLAFIVMFIGELLLVV